jgi:hypothetical protein
LPIEERRVVSAGHPFFGPRRKRATEVGLLWVVRPSRAGYLPPKGKGGATFIDPFAGPGNVRVRETGEIRDGSPLVAFRHREAAFTRLVFCDLDPENVRARTTAAGSRLSVVGGVCNQQIEQIVSILVHQAGRAPQSRLRRKQLI